MRKVKVFVVMALTLVLFSLLIVPAGAYTADDLANGLYSGWYSSGGSTYGSWYSVALYWLRTIGGDVSTATTSLGSIKTNTDNLSTILTRLTSLNSSMSTVNTNIGYIESNVSSIKSDVHAATLDIDYIYTLLTRAGTLGSDVNSIKSSANSIYTDVNSLKGYLTNIDFNVAALKSFFDNSAHRALEDAATGSVQEATSLYSSSVGGGSTASKMGDINSFSGDIAANLDTGVSAGQIFSVFSSGDDGQGGSIFSFFSQQTMDDLDPLAAQSRGRRAADEPEIVTHYYQDNFALFNRLVGSEER